MTEEQAREWIRAQFGASGLAAMERVAEIVLAEADQQNLVAASTLASIWSRHIVDSAQLLLLAESPERAGRWVDIGSGAGFPGLVVAALSHHKLWLVEPRKRRAAFLEHAASELGLGDRTEIACCKIEGLNVDATHISARAVAPLHDLFTWAAACATQQTQWLLPKGRGALEEVASAKRAWHGVFHVEHSITDPESLIVLATEVARR